MDVKKVRAAAARQGNFACAAAAGARLRPHTRAHPLTSPSRADERALAARRWPPGQLRGRRLVVVVVALLLGRLALALLGGGEG